MTPTIVEVIYGFSFTKKELCSMFPKLAKLNTYELVYKRSDKRYKRDNSDDNIDNQYDVDKIINQDDGDDNIDNILKQVGGLCYWDYNIGNFFNITNKKIEFNFTDFETDCGEQVCIGILLKKGSTYESDAITLPVISDEQKDIMNEFCIKNPKFSNPQYVIYYRNYKTLFEYLNKSE